MTVDQSRPSLSDLELFLVNNPDLNRLSGYLSRFNPIRVMRMERMEIRHSAILAWLLDPSETHGLGDKFIRAFLCEALKGEQLSVPSALDVLQADLYDAEVQREKNSIDIYVMVPRKGWAFIIENKFHSKQSDGQLARYLKSAEKRALELNQSLVHKGVFLALGDEEPHDSSFVRIQYREVFGILSQILDLNSESLSGDVRQFIGQYLEVIGESAGMSYELSEMETLAKSLYQRHRRAIDFIVEHGKSTSFTIAADQVFGADLQRGDVISDAPIPFMFNALNDFQVSFLPAVWWEALGGESTRGLWAGCEKWWASYPVICWIQLNRNSDNVKGRLFLYAEVGPISDPNARNRLIELISQSSLENIGFRADATRADAKYSKFLKENSVNISDVNDNEAIAKSMRLILDRFDTTFLNLRTALSTFTEEFGGANEQK
jgi:hypothetical protein